MLPPLNLSNSNSLGLFLCFIHTNLSLCLWNYYFSNVKLIVLYQTRPQQKKEETASSVPFTVVMAAELKTTNSLLSIAQN